MTENKRAIATDLKALDAHVVRPDEYDDAPELSAEQLAQADLHEGGKLIRPGRGRPPSPVRKTAVKFRLDHDLVAKLRASGPGWQTRVNAVLREAVLGETKVVRKTRKPRKAWAKTVRVTKVMTRHPHVTKKGKTKMK